MQRFATYEDLATHKARHVQRCWLLWMPACGQQYKHRLFRVLPAGPAAVLWEEWHCPFNATMQVTIEEREEYEQHIKMGTIVYAGGVARPTVLVGGAAWS